MVTSGVKTIMFTDLVGSTRMRDLRGDDVADRISSEHDAIVEAAVSSTGGRIVKRLGDGALVVFYSSVDAVRAAQRIQEGVRVHNRSAEESHQIDVRIGINVGEVVTDADGDVTGLPVAVASRVCDQANGGQIVVTSAVQSMIGRRARFPFLSIGIHVLKGVAEPVELWSVEEASPTAGLGRGGSVPLPRFVARGAVSTLVGRGDHIAQLDACYEAAAGGVQFVTVVGEPGIGKTALVSTWCSALEGEGAMVVAGRCTPDVALPYQPFIEAARQVLESHPELLPTLGPAAGNVAQLVPSVNVVSWLPPPPQTDLDTTRYLMAEAFAALLRPLGSVSPTVIVLEDLHWADEDSLAVLAHLVRYQDRLPLMILGTYRDTDLVAGHPLPALVTDFRRERRLTKIPLQRLDGGEVGEMVGRHFGAEVSELVVASISGETQGNPFFVEEVVAHLIDVEALDQDGQWVSDVPIEDYGIPEGIRDVVGRRLELLGEEAVAVLEVAAVIGPTFSLDVAAAIEGLSEEQCDDVIGKVTAAGIVGEGDGPDEFTFTHALIRQTLYDDLSARRRTRLHRNVGEELEQRNEPASVVLGHWLNAGSSDRALRAALRAADAAQEASAGSDILRYLQLVLDLWDDFDDPEKVARQSHAEIVIRLARTQMDFADPRIQTVDLVASEIQDGHVDDDEVRGQLYSIHAGGLWQVGRQAEAEAADLEALRLTKDDPPNSARAEALAGYGRRLVLQARLREGIGFAERGLAMGRIVESDLAIASAVTALGTSYGFLGELEKASVHFEALSALAQRTGRLSLRLLMHVNWGSILHDSGKPTDALHLFEEGIERATALGENNRYEAMLRVNAAVTLFDLSRWDEADRYIGAVPPSDRIDHPGINRALCVLTMAAERGDANSIADEWGHLAGVDIAALDPQMKGPIWAATVADLRWRGELVEAYDLAAEALVVISDGDAWPYVIRLSAFAIEVVADGAHVGIGDHSWLASARLWHARFAQEHPPGAYSAEFHVTATADLARAEGENDPDLWRIAVDAWGEHSYYGAKARWRLAEAELEEGGLTSEVATLLDNAASVATRLGAQPLLHAVRLLRDTT